METVTRQFVSNTKWISQRKHRRYLHHITEGMILYLQAIYTIYTHIELNILSIKSENPIRSFYVFTLTRLRSHESCTVPYMWTTHQYKALEGSV